MHDSDKLRLVDALSQLLQPHLARSEPLRAAAGLLGQWLLEQAEQAARPAEQRIAEITQATHDVVEAVNAPADAGIPQVAIVAGPPADVAVVAPTPVAVPTSKQPPAAPAVEPIMRTVKLRLGDVDQEVTVRGTPAEALRATQTAAAADAAANPPPRRRAIVDLPLVFERCLVKARAYAHIARRRPEQTRLEQSEFDKAKSELMLQAGRWQDCDLVAFRRPVAALGADVFQSIADCYQTQASAIDLLRRIDALDSDMADQERPVGIALLAEANSALRVALSLAATEDFLDQLEVYKWLREETYRRRIYVPRYMRDTDRAEPGNMADCAARITAAAAGIQALASEAASLKKALDKIRWHAAKICKSKDQDSTSDWTTIARTIRGLSPAPSDGQLRLIAKAIGAQAAVNELPLSVSSDVNLAAAINVARQLAAPRRLDRQPAGLPIRLPRKWGPDVYKVRELLRGRAMVLIGGQNIERAAARLREAFELSRLDWVDLKEHGPGQAMHAPIRRLDAALVVVIIKITGHEHANEAREQAAAAGIPCVNLPKGYSPEVMARCILKQASERLSQLSQKVA